LFSSHKDIIFFCFLDHDIISIQIQCRNGSYLFQQLYDGIP